MVGTGQHNDLVAMHSDVADGYVILTSILRAITRVLDCGYNLQACVKQDQPLVFRETDFIHRIAEIAPVKSRRARCTMSPDWMSMTKSNLSTTLPYHLSSLSSSPLITKILL